jgi:hypothetical protein
MKYKEASPFKKQAPSMPWNTIIKSTKSMEHISIASSSQHTIFFVIRCRICISCEHILNTLLLILRTEQCLCPTATQHPDRLWNPASYPMATVG